MQPYKLYTENLIKTDLFGSKTIYYRDKPHGVHRTKSQVSLAPNVIHSLDSSHLVRVINSATKKGMQMVCIHDEFATHAADIHDFRSIINYEFFELYTPDVLGGLEKQWKTDQPVLEYGDYEISEVLDAQYFFG